MHKLRTLKISVATFGAAMLLAGVARAQFTPIALDPASFNADVVVEAAAPKTVNSYVTATMDGGTNKTGATFFERGYMGLQTNGVPFTNGLPLADSVLSNIAGDRIWRMPPDYKTNNVILVGKHNNNREAFLPVGTLTFTAPTTYSGLSVLCCSGGAAVQVAYTIHYADSSTESGVLTSPDWFNGATAVVNCAGRVTVPGGLANIDANPGVRLFQVDIGVANPTVNIVSIDFDVFQINAGNKYTGTARAAIFAICGAKDGDIQYTNSIAVSGYNQDVVVEFDAPITGGGVNQLNPCPAQITGNLTNYITHSIDGGTNRNNNVWYEKGLYLSFPSSGIPVAGSTFNSATLPASYTMPSSYTTNNAAFLSRDVTTANIYFAAPAAYGALSFLAASGGGDTFVPCVVRFADGSTENNTIFIPDWFNRDVPSAHHVWGRVNAGNRAINSSPDTQFNPFLARPTGTDFRGLTIPGMYLYDVVLNVTNTTSAITNVSLSFAYSNSTRVPTIFAVSGAAPNNVPPVFGVRGSGGVGGGGMGQPLNSLVRDRVMTKMWEGTNTVILAVTNSAGSGPITYQWKKAPRGLGWRNVLLKWDYTAFGNVVNGGRISGATSSALVISNALSADSADYLCVASNGSGSTTSLVATVMILTTNLSILKGAPAGDIIAQTAADATPAAESVDHAIDRVAQKWLSDGLQWGGACCGGPAPFTGPVGFTVQPVSGASIATSIRFINANDDQNRDPIDYGLDGSNDGSTWTPITGGVLMGTLYLPTGRNGVGTTPVDPLAQNAIQVDFANATAYKYYRFSTTNVYQPHNSQLMQVGEVELLGTLVPNPPVWVRQPQPTATVYIGGSPVMSVDAAGYPLPTYQWYKGGTAIPGATGSVYTAPNVQLSDSGTNYSCIASNLFGSTNSTTLTLTVISPPGESYPSAVLADSPSGYWRLNEADNAAGNNGAIAHDYRGARNGTYSNTVNAVSGYNPLIDSDTATQVGNLAAANCYVADIRDVDFARATNAPQKPFSIEAWAYGGAQSVDAAIVTKGYNGALLAGTGTGSEQFVLDVAGTPRRFRFLVRDAAGSGHVAQSTITPYDPLNSSIAQWHHLVGVCDQAAGKVYLYVDGNLAGTGDLPANLGIETQPLLMTIGARKSSGNTEFDNQWNGKIDDVAVYNTALSAAQVQNHFYAAQYPPIFTLYPTNTTVSDNTIVTFYSSAYGVGTVSYQWYLSDGVNPTTPVAGQTSANMSFLTTPAHNGNNYQVVATNLYGATTSSVAVLTVVSGPPSYTVNLPASQTFLVGHVITLHVDVLGTAPFTYQWQKNGTNLPNTYRIYGTQTNELVIGYANFEDSGNYQVLVTGGAGTTPSTLDALTVTNSTSSVVAMSPSGTGWTLNGNTAPIMGNDRVELTSGAGNTARSVFHNAKQPISAFNARFIYQTVSGAGGADGVTFCIQNQALTAVGAGGGGLGYGTITPSAALALNIFATQTRGIRFFTGGTVITPFLPIDPVLIGGNTNPVLVTLAYGGGVLNGTFRDLITSATFTTNITVDIPTAVGGADAYVGFTGADGGVASTQVISNFTMAPPPVTLSAQRVGSTLVLSWPAAAGAVLRSTTSISPPTTWTDVTEQFQVINNRGTVTVPTSPGTKFYRLDVYP